MNPFAKTNPQNANASASDLEAMRREIENNPIIRLQMSDNALKNELMKNQTPQNAEMLIERKMRSIGMDDKEIVIVLMCDGYKYPIEKAMSETGLDADSINALYDSGIAKINKALNSGGLVANARNLFK